jgi:hypothetical protein
MKTLLEAPVRATKPGRNGKHSHKTLESPAVVSHWKRFLACSCSHGEYQDPIAVDAFLEFKRRWKPHTTLHLGDLFDFACLRTGAITNPLDSDYTQDPGVDISHGLEFLKRMEPQWYTWGNHEARLQHLAGSSCATLRLAARHIIDVIDKQCEALGVNVIRDWSIFRHVKIGQYKVFHGTLFGSNYIQRSAQAFGNCIVGHGHAAGMATAARSDNAAAYSVGCLRTVETATYAAARPATFGWSQGWCWGEYTDEHAVVWLHSQPPNSAWRLPI